MSDDEYLKHGFEYMLDGWRTMQAEILRLRAENAKLRAALKPCVDYFSWNGGLIRDEEYEAAAAALKETNDEND